MINNYVLPKLVHNDRFENIVCNILVNDFRNPNIYRYGRKGQSQKGIDTVGIARSNYVNDELIGVQYKNHVVSILDEKLQKEINNRLINFEKNNLPYSTVNPYYKCR